MQKKQKFIAAGIGAGAIAVGVALTGGTSAYFIDTENEHATFAAGKLDLVTSGAVTPAKPGQLNPLASVSYDAATNTLHASNLQPGDTFTYTLTYTNAGTLNAHPYMIWKVSNDQENGISEAESKDGTADNGELDDALVVSSNSVLTGLGAVAAPVRSFANEVTDLKADLAPEKSGTAAFTFTVPNGGQGAENAIMTDSLDVTIDVALTQVGAPKPAL